MLGLVSVTFRSLLPAAIIEWVAKAGLDGIEWGADVHVQPDQPAVAVDVAARMADAGLQTLSYGSYYRLLTPLPEGAGLDPLLRTAVTLGAPNLRVWAGSVSPDKADDALFEAASAELRQVCQRASDQGIRISLEYHRNSLTETAEGALRLVRQTDHPNLYLYWQANPEISHRRNCDELEAVRPYLSNLHVFHWTPAGEQLALADGTAFWADYLRCAGYAERRDSTHLLLEFVRGENPQQFLEDAAVLRRWTVDELRRSDAAELRRRDTDELRRSDATELRRRDTDTQA